ncbi:exonuclease domain-containing protein [Cellulomonas marina]|uniref:exonuclease domain-containing protein n=1 Tax=Cellulomonas marina TaxID=988821 RepID=UPI000B7E56D2|nr:exonuclease domain-containing protein [Cellulomonas marina]
MAVRRTWARPASWTRGPLLGFDTETTGVDVARDRIVAAALVLRDAHGTRVRSWLVDPGVEIPAAASAVHGISTAHARAHGRPPAAVLDEVAGALAAALAEGTPVVAFNACFDLSILDAELRRHGLPTLPERLGRAAAPVLDPLVLDRAQDRHRRGPRRLGDLCRLYGVTADGDLHTAHVDVLATLDVLGRLVERFPALGDADPAELHAFQARAHRRWAEAVNARRRERGETGPDADPSWPALVVPSPVAA